MYLMRQSLLPNLLQIRRSLSWHRSQATMMCQVMKQRRQSLRRPDWRPPKMRRLTKQWLSQWNLLGQRRMLPRTRRRTRTQLWKTLQVRTPLQMKKQVTRPLPMMLQAY
jgi:hypothetical protein